MPIMCMCSKSDFQKQMSQWYFKKYIISFTLENIISKLTILFSMIEKIPKCIFASK